MESFLIFITAWVAKIILEIGYLGIFALMAIESSFIPFPSEIIIPPAAYWASQGQLNVFLVVVAGIAGSLAGALVNYCLALSLGRKIIFSLAASNWAKFLLVNQSKIARAEKYFLKYGRISTFFGRLVPWVRQLISIPAGFSRMALAKFLFYTGLGSGIWVIILAVLGYFFGANQSQLERYYQEITWLLVVVVGIVFGLFILKKIISKKQEQIKFRNNEIQ